MEAIQEKPNKQTRAKTRAIARLTKALEAIQNASLDVEMAKMPHQVRMDVARARDAIKTALKSIFVHKT